MSRLVHQLLVASVLALYGSVSLGDAALHGLDGLGHSDCPGPASHDDRPGLTRGSSPDECLICHLHVQGQIPVVMTTLVHEPLVSAGDPAVRRVAARPARHTSSCPRAPPIAPASLS